MESVSYFSDKSFNCFEKWNLSEQRSSIMLLVDAVLLVVSIIFLLIGFLILIPAISQFSFLLVIGGFSLFGIGVLGVLFISLLFGLKHYRKNLFLREENKILIEKHNFFANKDNKVIEELQSNLINIQESLLKIEDINNRTTQLLQDEWESTTLRIKDLIEELKMEDTKVYQKKESAIQFLQKEKTKSELKLLQVQQLLYFINDTQT